MPFFKSNKNKTSSAASTPVQTPRSSIQTTRTANQSNLLTLDQLCSIKSASAFRNPYILVTVKLPIAVPTRTFRRDSRFETGAASATRAHDLAENRYRAVGHFRLLRGPALDLWSYDLEVAEVCYGLMSMLHMGYCSLYPSWR
ncbi:hypothetical protein BC939DRAFT_480745 [Gamsiella multidivaricata]|uniref:uncharacterized protein n=1 Tax=Gamsiella multidivaricata TaxID=101098 RepID=UPI0022205399|nr:uncharacterized protein BC939DRAFT_480745 [Gamsiella multidivaricata]KAI7817982.1 hypothetical protein BC939DRAFT_480745 [Gamsiella multidivaricata]